MKRRFLLGIALGVCIITGIGAEEPVVEPTIDVETCIAGQCHGCSGGCSSCLSSRYDSDETANDDDEDDRDAAGRSNSLRVARAHGTELDYTSADNLDEIREEQCQQCQPEQCQSLANEPQQSRPAEEEVVAGLTSTIVIKEAVQ